MKIYALDIGGSSIKHAIVESDGKNAKIVQRFKKKELSSRSFKALKESIFSLVRTRDEELKEPLPIGISTSGAVKRNGFVISAGHFSGYINVDWQNLINTVLHSPHRPVVTINDGKASTLAEYKLSGEASEAYAHFVVGTGVGGGLICFDKILYGDDETAGALGHMKVGSDNGIVCSCENTGCLETRASGPAIVRAFNRGQNLRNSESATTDFGFVFEQAQSGNTAAISAFEEGGRWLGIGIANIINIFNPRRISVGGGVIDASSELDTSLGGPYLQAAIKTAQKTAFDDIALRTEIFPAKTKNDGGLLGAAIATAGACGTQK